MVISAGDRLSENSELVFHYIRRSARIFHFERKSEVFSEIWSKLFNQSRRRKCVYVDFVGLITYGSSRKKHRQENLEIFKYFQIVTKKVTKDQYLYISKQMYASAVLTFLEYIFCVYITEIFKNFTQAQKKPGFEVKAPP